jgi:hypothetical protein
VGIVLKHDGDDETYYESPPGGAEGQSDVHSADPVATMHDLVGEDAPVDPSSNLPSALVIGPGALEGSGVPSSIGATQGPRGPGTAIGGKARPRVFGVEGEGYRFVYVFDRSTSMGGSGRNCLEAAKAELIASLESLEQTHQFQIIFYNEQPRRFDPWGDPDRMVFATEQNKALAAKFVRGITAFGNTEHEAALVAAIKFRPDVIFFLTDAAEPMLYPNQLAKIRRMANGISINAIEFGLGPQHDANNFLSKLAAQNGGSHGYVDVSSLISPRGQ